MKSQSTKVAAQAMGTITKRATPSASDVANIRPGLDRRHQADTLFERFSIVMP